MSRRDGIVAVQRRSDSFRFRSGRSTPKRPFGIRHPLNTLDPLSPRKAGGDAEGRGGRPVAERGSPPCMFALAREPLVPSFLRRQESRRSVGVKGTPNVRRRPITRGALGDLVGRRADGGSSHGSAVAWIPASAGMTDRAPTALTELIFNTVALSLRDISPPHGGGRVIRSFLGCRPPQPLVDLVAACSVSGGASPAQSPERAASRARAGAWLTSPSWRSRVQAANSSMIPSGS